MKGKTDGRLFSRQGTTGADMRLLWPQIVWQGISNTMRENGAP